MATDSTIGLKCRCCGKAVPPVDSYPIHTACIPKHWDRHAHGVNAGRCQEFGSKRIPTWGEFDCDKGYHKYPQEGPMICLLCEITAAAFR